MSTSSCANRLRSSRERRPIVANNSFPTVTAFGPVPMTVETTNCTLTYHSAMFCYFQSHQTKALRDAGANVVLEAISSESVRLQRSNCYTFQIFKTFKGALHIRK